VQRVRRAATQSCGVCGSVGLDAASIDSKCIGCINSGCFNRSDDNAGHANSDRRPSHSGLKHGRSCSLCPGDACVNRISSDHFNHGDFAFRNIFNFEAVAG
jgi:hypothetical protein